MVPLDELVVSWVILPTVGVAIEPVSWVSKTETDDAAPVALTATDEPAPPSETGEAEVVVEPTMMLPELVIAPLFVMETALAPPVPPVAGVPC